MIKVWIYREWKRRIYWAWRLSIWSRPWFFIRTWIHLLLNARATAVALSNCLRAFGQMHASSKHTDMRLMRNSTRSELADQGFKLMPDWRWRKD